MGIDGYDFTVNIKLIIFDLDGVLVDSREFHYAALNNALAEAGEQFVISQKEHLSQYDGLSTRKKLDLLTQNKQLDPALHQQIWRRKQVLTAQAIQQTVKPDTTITQLLKKLTSDGYKLYVCSNSIRDTVLAVLENMAISQYFDQAISNEDVALPKPHPEMYWKAMVQEQVLPKETLIIEDSYIGRTAAISSGANLCPVREPSEVTIERIYAEMNQVAKPKKWQDKKLNVLIPMAGAGSRFVSAGYSFPKPLIDIKNQPMIKWVVDNLNVEANFIFIVQRVHCEKYNIKSLLNIIAPTCEIILVDQLTDGACRTTLLAKSFINSDNPLLIANSDQLVEWESGEFFHAMNAPNIDGGILTFQSTHPKWSYVKLNDRGNVTDLREKEVISDIATVGIYYWAKGADYVKYAEQMIDKNIKVNDEFYVAPTYNEAIADGKTIKTYEVAQMWGLGTPEDLDYFLQKIPPNPPL